jgi:hypothetical protein
MKIHMKIRSQNDKKMSKFLILIASVRVATAILATNCTNLAFISKVIQQCSFYNNETVGLLRFEIN